MIKNIKKKIYELVEVTEDSSGRRVFDFFDISILILILLNIIAVILETIKSLYFRYEYYFYAFEVFSVVIFTIEYILRLWVCTVDERFKNPFLGRIKFAFTPLALVDLFAFLPFYLPMILPLDLRFIRIFRLFRIIRILKLGKYSESITNIGKVITAKKEELIITVSLLAILLIFSSSLMYYVEYDAQPKVFSSIPAAMWWGIVTLTTVGYGDIYPITTLGKILAAIISLLGIGMFALPAGILASGFGDALKKEGEKVCPHCGRGMGKQ